MPSRERGHFYGRYGRGGLKARCTNSRHRFVSRHLHEDAFCRMQQRATTEMMRLRRSTVEHPFAFLKYRIFWASALPVARTRRNADRNQSGCDGLQPGTNAKPSGRNSVLTTASLLIRAPTRKSGVRISRTPLLHRLRAPSFVTDCLGLPFCIKSRSVR
jgi:hypothetical protein